MASHCAEFSHPSRSSCRLAARNTIFGRHEQILRATRRLKSLHLEVVAAAVSPEMCSAFLTDDLRRSRHLRPNAQIRNARAYSLNRSAILVALCHRISRERVFSVPDMDIGIADSDAPNTQEDITQPCIWIRCFSKFNLSGPGLHCLTLITRAGSVLTVPFAIQLHLPVMKQPRPREPAVLVSETRFNLFSATWRGGAVWDHVVEIEVAADGSSGLMDRVVSMRIELFILDEFPDSFEDVVAPTSARRS